MIRDTADNEYRRTASSMLPPLFAAHAWTMRSQMAQPSQSRWQELQGRKPTHLLHPGRGPPCALAALPRTAAPGGNTRPRCSRPPCTCECPAASAYVLPPRLSCAQTPCRQGTQGGKSSEVQHRMRLPHTIAHSCPFAMQQRCEPPRPHVLQHAAHQHAASTQRMAVVAWRCNAFVTTWEHGQRSTVAHSSWVQVRVMCAPFPPTHPSPPRGPLQLQLAL